MKKFLLSAVILAIWSLSFSQPMHVKKYNFTSFGQDKKMDVSILNKESSAEAKRHPEYGIRPYNVQCDECVELLDQRTINSRQLINPYNEHRMYSQRSYFPLHYKKSENDIWRTIDYRLRPDANTPGVYTADNQPVPTKCDLSRKLTSLNENGFVFEWNKDLTMYFYDENMAYTAPQKGNYNQYTIGEEGLEVQNMWQGINMQQIFATGQVESNFVINAPLQLPINKGWMVIEDHFSLNEGMTIEESPTGKYNENGFYQGDYLIKDKDGNILITYEKAAYTDAIAFSMHGMYKLIKSGNDYILQILVPVSWLTNNNNTYPIIIDPVVWGKTRYGHFQSSGDSEAGLGFTTMPASCDYHMQGPNSVIVPGRSQLTDVYADIEYKLTHSASCGSPSEPAPYCTFSQASMSIVSDSCHVSTGPLSCTPTQPPYTGTCTTDSNAAPLAGSIHINQYFPNYLTCFAPQCPDYYIPFTLKNQDSICGDACGYLCASGNMWSMTVYACRVEGNILQDPLQPNVGSTNFTASATCGVPPYRYAWSVDGGVTYDTIYGNPHYTTATQNGHINCIIYDSCWEAWATDTIALITAISSIKDDANTINITPNPSDGNFEIRFSSNENTPNSSLRILDNTGRLISTRQISVSTGNNIYSFHPESKLATGEYWIEIAVGKTLLHKKFIVL